MLSFMLQILILLFFQYLYYTIENSHFVDNRPTPTLNYYLQSISTNNEVFLSPIIFTSNKSLTTGRSIRKYSFPKSDIQFGYHYRDDMVYFHGRLNQNHIMVNIFSATSKKYHEEKYFIANEEGHDYELLKDVSLVDVGDYVLLYGICFNVYFFICISYIFLLPRRK